MREDIQGGIKNAMERGASLEQAVKSFINAGYSEAEVRDAAKIFTLPAIAVVNSPSSSNAQKQVQPLHAKPPAQAQPQAQIQPVQQGQVHTALTSGLSGTNKTMIILIAVLTVLVGIFIASLIFKDQIINTLKTALGK